MSGCISAGTLGGFDTRTFPVSQKALIQTIDTFFAIHPEYQIPDKWKAFDTWKERGYDFLKSRIFYLKSEPEEMYYVTFVVGQNESMENISTSIAIRAVNNGSGHWTLEDETSLKDKERIEKRFETEIISRLEQYSNTKSIREE